MPRRTLLHCLTLATIILIVTTARAQSDFAAKMDQAQVLHSQRAYDRALPLLQEVLKAIDDGKLPEQQYLGRCLTPLVDIYVQTEQFEKALPLAVRQLKWYESQQKDLFTRRRVLEYQRRLGDIYDRLGKSDQARATWKRAVPATRDEDLVVETLRLEIACRLAESDPSRRENANVLTQLARDARAFRQQLAAVERNQESTDLLARTAKVEAQCFAMAGDPREAAATLRDVLPRLETPPHPEYLPDLVQIAVWERDAGNAKAAEQLLQNVLRVKRYGGNPPTRALILEQLGLALKSAGKTAAAEQCWRMLLETEAKIDPASLQSTSERLSSLNRLRNAHQELRQLPQALRAAEAYYAMVAQLPSAPSDMRRHARDRLGVLCVATGNYVRAEKLLVESLALAQQHGDVDPNELVVTRTNLANAYRKLARTEEAEALFREVLADLQQRHQPGDLALPEAQSNVAAMLTERGQFADAMALLRQSLAGAEQAGPRGNALRASLLQFLAINYLSQGQLDRAAEQLRAAIEIEGAAQASNPDITRRVIERYIALARVELARKQRDAAADACEHALAMAEDAALQDDPVQSTLRRLAGEIALDAGDEADAKKYWLAALDTERSRSARADVARTLADLGDLSVRQRRFTQAEVYYRRALDQQADVFHLPILHYNILGNLGQVVYYHKGDHAAGLELLKKAADLLEIPRAATTGGGELQRADFLARRATVFDLLVDNSLAAGNTADAFHYAERARNRTFLDQLQIAGVDLRETLPADKSAELNHRERDLAARLAKLRVDAATAPPQGDAAKKLTLEVRSLQDEYAQVWSEIRDASPFYRDVLKRRLGVGVLADVQREAIPADALMLFYVIGDFQSHILLIGHEPNDVTVFDLKLPAALQKELHSDADWLTRATALQLVNEYVAALRNVEGGRGLAGVARSPKGFMEAERGQTVTEILLPAEVRKQIAKRAPKHVIVIPDGALHELPLECLVISPGERPVFALDTLPPLTYAPSATILLSLATRSPARHDAQPQLLSVGNPRYNASDSPHENSLAAITRDAFVDLGGRLSPLPGTIAECERAVAAFGAEHSELLLGDAATESAVRREMPGRTYLHLAAHGLVNERDDNLFGAIALTPPQAIVPDDDGFLNLHEIFGLNLSDCELAALSACQTNVGGERPLEASSTLARAFLAAGARRVICSHWNVDDEAGSELIARFWEEVAAEQKSGTTVHFADALRNAQRRIRQRPEFASAYYWAPFVLIGPADATR